MTYEQAMIERRGFLIGLLASPALVRASSLDFVPRAVPTPGVMTLEDMIALQDAFRDHLIDQFVNPPLLMDRMRIVGFHEPDAALVREVMGDG